jgi:hypothetical protein
VIEEVERTLDLRVLARPRALGFHERGAPPSDQEQRRVAHDGAKPAGEHHHPQTQLALSGKRRGGVQGRLAREHRDHRVGGDQGEDRKVGPWGLAVDQGKAIAVVDRGQHDDDNDDEGRQANREQDRARRHMPAAPALSRLSPLDGIHLVCLRVVQWPAHSIGVIARRHIP